MHDYIRIRIITEYDTNFQKLIGTNLLNIFLKRGGSFIKFIPDFRTLVVTNVPISRIVSYTLKTYIAQILQNPCLSHGFYSWTNIMTKKLGRKGFIQLIFPHCCSSLKKSGLELKQVREQELMQRLWRDVSSLLPLACSACSLIEPRLPAQRWHHPQGDLPTWSLIEKMPYSWISWRHFPNWSSFLCDNSSLCQVDTKLASTLHSIKIPCGVRLFRKNNKQTNKQTNTKKHRI